MLPRVSDSLFYRGGERATLDRAALRIDPQVSDAGNAAGDLNLRGDVKDGSRLCRAFQRRACAQAQREEPAANRKRSDGARLTDDRASLKFSFAGVGSGIPNQGQFIQRIDLLRRCVVFFEKRISFAFQIAYLLHVVALRLIRLADDLAFVCAGILNADLAGNIGWPLGLVVDRKCDNGSDQESDSKRDNSLVHGDRPPVAELSRAASLRVNNPVVLGVLGRAA